MQTQTVNLTDLEMRYAKLRVRNRREESRLLINMEQVGQRNPIVVTPSSGRWVVIDGHKRVRVLRRLKADVAQAVVWDMDSEAALLRAYELSSTTRWKAIEEGRLVYELHRRERWDLGRIAAGMDRTKSWVSRRLGLVEELPEGVLDQVQKGVIGAYVAQKYLLPLARANGRLCEVLAGKISACEMSSRQIGVIYRHCVSGSKQAAERIVSDPVTFLRALEASRSADQDLALSEEENRCVKHLQLIGNVSLGLARYLPRITEQAGSAARQKLRKSWDEARKGFGFLECKVKAMKFSAGG